MKVYKTQQEVEKDIKDGVLTINGDVRFECSISIKSSIMVICGNINAESINARDINAMDITAWNINAWDINAMDITAEDINAWDITAGNINAWNISYYAFCCVYQSIKCLSIKAKREIYQNPICLEGKLEIKKPETKNPKEIVIDGAKYRLVE